MNNVPPSLTPRDHLLSRHAAACPQLDALRLAVLPAPPFSWRQFAAELFRPHRHVWQVIAAVWLGLLAWNFSFARAHPTTPVATPPPEAVATWLAQFKAHAPLAQIDSHP